VAKVGVKSNVKFFRLENGKLERIFVQFFLLLQTILTLIYVLSYRQRL